MDTQKLYYHDSYQRQFSSRILDIKESEGRFHVALEQTFFYPTSGGQPFDTGYINQTKVLDVYEDNDLIYHVLEECPKNQMAIGKIDWERRFDHMQQHGGQHLLSAVFEKLLNLDTVGFHLGSDVVTIDLSCSSLSEKEVELIENQANEIIYLDLPIKAYFVTEEELSSLPLRKQPSVKENIRIVEIDDYDYSPCGGTHPSSTGQIGIIKILRWEKSKDHIRVTFLCGSRALKDYRQKNAVILSAAASLSVKDTELAASIDRLLLQNKNFQKEMKNHKESLVHYEAKALHQQGAIIEDIRIVKGYFPEKNMDELRLLSSILASYPNTIALLAGGKANGYLLMSRSEELSIKMNEIFRQVIGLVDGKGGGNPKSAQGGGPKTENLMKALDQSFLLVSQVLQHDKEK